MFGFYDHKSLTLGPEGAAIDFIDAADGAVTTVDIRTTAEAESIAGSLRDQARFGIASRAGSIREIRGSVVLSPSGNGEGLISVAGAAPHTLPMVMAFDAEEGQIPHRGFAILHGVRHRGAVVVHKMALKPVAPSVDLTHAEAAPL